MTTKERLIGHTKIYGLLVYLTDKTLEVRRDMDTINYSLKLSKRTKNLDHKVYMILANGWEHGYYTAEIWHLNLAVKKQIVADKKAASFIKPVLLVHIMYSDGLYTAVCDDLHLVTEAETIDELRDIVWDLAADMIEANNLDIDPRSLRLIFEISQSAEEYRKTK